MSLNCGWFCNSLPHSSSRVLALPTFLAFRYIVKSHAIWKKHFILPVFNVLFFSFIQYHLSHVMNHRGHKFQISFLDYSLFYKLLSGPFLFQLNNKQNPSVLFLFILVFSEFVLFDFLGKKVCFYLLSRKGISPRHSVVENHPKKLFLELSLSFKMDAINLLWSATQKCTAPLSHFSQNSSVCKKHISWVGVVSLFLLGFCLLGVGVFCRWFWFVVCLGFFQTLSQLSQTLFLGCLL